jgi:hypothetical protein
VALHLRVSRELFERLVDRRDRLREDRGPMVTLSEAARDAIEAGLEVR